MLALGRFKSEKNLTESEIFRKLRVSESFYFNNFSNEAKVNKIFCLKRKIFLIKLGATFVSLDSKW